MIKLFFLKVIPLMSRPLAIFLDGYFAGDRKLLVYLLPTSMMALAVSSVPIYRRYYLARFSTGVEIKRADNLSEIESEYCGQLLLLTVICSLLVFVICHHFDDKYDVLFPFIASFLFVSEKFFDEITRLLEYKKQFGRWCIVQSMRSAWMVLPALILLLIHNYYQVSMLVLSALASISSLFVFKVILVRAKPKISLVSLYRLISEFRLIPGVMSLSMARNIPRLLVAHYYLPVAHIYIALAQLTQGVNLLYDVRFMAPVRRVMAIRPYSYARILKPLYIKIIMFCVLLVIIMTVLSLIAPALFILDGNLIAYVIVLLMLFSEASIGAIFGSIVSLPQWILSDTKLSKLYLMVALSFVVLALLMYQIIRLANLGIVSYSAVTTLCLSVLSFVVYERHLTRSKSES